MRLHIHFGIHRTGTTSIHKALSGNKRVLEEQGVLYPDLGFDSRHVKLAWHLISGKLSYQEALQRIRSETNDSTKLIVLSSEDFCLLDIEKWMKLLVEHYEVTASIYLRRQDLWLESWYNQHIKWPWSAKFSSATPDFFLKNANDFYWLDYEKMLSRISKALPKGTLYVNTMESSSITNTTDDFLKQIEVDPASLASYEVRNASLTTAKLDIVRRIDLQGVKPKARNAILSALNEIDIKEDDGKKIVFTDDQVKKIGKKYDKGNRRVAREYFNRDELFMDPVVKGRKPSFVDEGKAFHHYIPLLLKKIAQKEA